MYEWVSLNFGLHLWALKEESFCLNHQCTVMYRWWSIDGSCRCFPKTAKFGIAGLVAIFITAVNPAVASNPWVQVSPSPATAALDEIAYGNGLWVGLGHLPSVVVTSEE